MPSDYHSSDFKPVGGSVPRLVSGDLVDDIINAVTPILQHDTDIDRGMEPWEQHARHELRKQIKKVLRKHSR